MGRFEINPNLDAELRRSRAVREALEDITEDAADNYRDTVPVDEGDLQESIFADVAMTSRGYQGRVGATDWKAGLVEFGTSRRPPDGSLRRAVESTGARFETGPGR